MSRFLQLFPPPSLLEPDRLGVFDAVPEVRTVAATAVYPPINAWECGDDAFIEAEVPGIPREKLGVTVCAGELTIDGVHSTVDTAGSRWQSRERPAGPFRRTIVLPWDVDSTRVEAKLEDGVLTLRLPKAASSKPRKVPVSGS